MVGIEVGLFNMKKVMKKNDILKVAKGVSSPSTIMEINYWDNNTNSKKEFLSFRREARRAIYKIIKAKKLGNDITDVSTLQMQDIINPQLDSNRGINWNNFTMNWDLHPKDVKKIVIKEHWAREGGSFDNDVGSCLPTAFTNQKII